jgi:K+-sensing histidine kinase KdpD
MLTRRPDEPDSGSVTGRSVWTNVYLPIGALGAIGLGIILIPLRELTSASNLAFAFLVWTIVVGELGGRSAALTTAVVSGISLNFFLTRPYLTLQIHDREDIIAFVALGVSGLIAAAFGRRRQASTAAASEVTAGLDTISRITTLLYGEAPSADRLTAALDEVRRTFRLRAVALRDASGRTVARVDPEGVGLVVRSPQALEPDTLLAVEGTHHRVGERGLRLPGEGGRIPLQARGEPIGSLDLWEGDPAGLDVEECKALTVIARLLATQLPRD